MLVVCRIPVLLFLLLLVVPGIAGNSSLQSSAMAAGEQSKLTPIDLKILRKADEILADESKWNRKCERKYKKEDKTWSLYSALQKAELEVTGMHAHRQPALEEVR